MLPHEVIQRFPRSRSRGQLLLGVAGCFLMVTCGPALKRDLTKVPVGQVGFDDLCGMQDYFDAIELKKAEPPKLISSAQIEGDKVRGGRSRFAFETDFQLAAARRVLDENWRRLPEGVSTAKRIDLEVQWSGRGSLQRVVTNEDARVILNDKEEFSLPYHVCLSELLFGAPLYHQRREALGLAPLPLPRPMTLKENTDGGTADGPGGTSGPARSSDGGGTGPDGGPPRSTSVR
jgi:hypothetical protein